MQLSRYRFGIQALLFGRLIFPMEKMEMVETRRIELLTPCLQGRCSPS